MAQENDESQNMSPSTSLISPTNILQLVTMPFTILMYLLSNSISFLSNLRIPVLTGEQEEIMAATPGLQKVLRTSMTKVSADQEKIGTDIDDLKARLARLDERRRMRTEALESLKED